MRYINTEVKKMYLKIAFYKEKKKVKYKAS